MAIGALLAIGAGIANAAANAFGQQKQLNNQRNLMDLQFRNQQALNVQGQQLALDTWKKTNYPAQMEMLKEAGLNPALMYGQAGASGSTNSGSGGSASGGSAPYVQPMDIMNIVAMQQAKADIELKEANAKLAETQADKLAGVDTAAGQANIEATKAGINKIIAETANEWLKGELIQVQTEQQKIQNARTDEQITTALNNIKASTNKLLTENQLTQDNANNIIAETKSKVIKNYADTDLAKSNISLNETEQEAIYTKINQEYLRLEQSSRSLDQKDLEIAISKFNAEIDAKYPNTGEVAGAIVKKAYLTLKNWIETKVPLEDKVN